MQQVAEVTTLQGVQKPFPDGKLDEEQILPGRTAFTIAHAKVAPSVG